METFDVYLNSKWMPLKDIDIKKPAKYLIRIANSDTYKNWIQILEVGEHTWYNGLWVFINGNSYQLNRHLIENYEVAGPIMFWNEKREDQ